MSGDRSRRGQVVKNLPRNPMCQGPWHPNTQNHSMCFIVEDGTWRTRFCLGVFFGKRPKTLAIPKVIPRWLLNQPIWKILVKLDHFFRVKIKNLWNHHLDSRLKINLDFCQYLHSQVLRCFPIDLHFLPHQRNASNMNHEIVVRCDRMRMSCLIIILIYMYT